MINYRRILRAAVAFLVFIVIVIIGSFLADILGEKSSTGPIRIIIWLAGSLIAFKIFEIMDDEKKD
ncbi:MAG: hypothetical protein KO275_03410 [Methanobacterium sp.]|jgi:positive regulator of sigma E activity|nr:hypothetical protein [Methanobacterium sp.]